MKLFSNIYNTLLREVGIIISDRNIMMIVIIAPLFYAFFYGSIYINKTESKVKIGVVDLDHSTSSRNLVKKINAHQLLDVVVTTSNLEEAKGQFYRSNIQGIVYIDNDYEKNLKKGKTALLKMYLNTSRFLVSNDINKAMNEVALAVGDDYKRDFFRTAGYSKEQADEMSETLKLDIRPLFNTSETYGDFLIPALIVLILQQTLLIGLGESIAKEREKGTMIQLFSHSNHSITSVIFGKTIFYGILYSIYALFFFSIHFYIFKIKIDTSRYLELTVLTLLFLTTVIFFGSFIATFFKRKILALQVLAFSTYPFFFLTGYSWPYQSLPEGLKILSLAFPLTPYLNSFTRVAMMGANFSHIQMQILHLLILIVVYYFLARYRTKKIIREEELGLVHPEAD